MPNCTRTGQQVFHHHHQLSPASERDLWWFLCKTCKAGELLTFISCIATKGMVDCWKHLDMLWMLGEETSRSSRVYFIGWWFQTFLWIFTPKPWGFMIQFDDHIFFKWVGSTTNWATLSAATAWGPGRLGDLPEICFRCLAKRNKSEVKGYVWWLPSETLVAAGKSSVEFDCYAMVEWKMVCLNTFWTWCL